MGTLDPQSSNVKRKIALVNVTGLTASQVENAFNTNFGSNGWRIIQIVTIGANLFVVAEKEQ